MFEVKINSSNHRVNTGAIEKVLEATFAEVLSEEVHVLVTQTDDHTLAVELDRTVGYRKAALAEARADKVWARAEARMKAEEDSATETRAELEARIREECAAEYAAEEAANLEAGGGYPE